MPRAAPAATATRKRRRLAEPRPRSAKPRNGNMPAPGTMSTHAASPPHTPARPPRPLHTACQAANSSAAATVWLLRVVAKLVRIVPAAAAASVNVRSGAPRAGWRARARDNPAIIQAALPPTSNKATR